MMEWRKDISEIGQILGCGDSFLVDFGFDQMKEAAGTAVEAERENATMLDLLTEIGNELFHAAEFGEWYAEQGDSEFMHKLAKKLNDLVGL